MKPQIIQLYRLQSVSSIAAVLLVSGLVACSTSRPKTGEHVGEQITFTNASIQIDGEALGNQAGWTASGPAGGILALTVDDSATFLISERFFEGSLPTAQVSGNRLDADYFDYSIAIQSEETIHPKGDADLWVHRDPMFHVHSDSAAPAEFRSYWAGSYAQYFDRLEKNLPEWFGKGPGGERFISNPTERSLSFYVAIQQEPRLIGGLEKLQERVEYPEEARRNGIEGTVLVRFIIETNGIPSNLEVIQGIGGGCDEAAMAAVSEARFEPGITGGEPVRVQYTIPIAFGL